MSKAAVQYRRDQHGKWQPVGVWFATPKALQSRFVPGYLDAWVRGIHQDAAPPMLDDERTRGTWEDWIWYALDALSNGHDLHIAEVEPELTVDETYAKYVLGLNKAQRRRYQPKTIPNVTTVPVDELTNPEARA